MLARRLARQGLGQLAQTLLRPRCPGCCAAAASPTHQQRRSFARRPPDGGAPSIREQALQEDLGQAPRPPWWPKVKKRPAGSGPAPAHTPRTARPAASSKESATSSAAAPESEHTERVAKRLARVGLCSRREADE